MLNCLLFPQTIVSHLQLEESSRKGGGGRQCWYYCSYRILFKLIHVCCLGKCGFSFLFCNTNPFCQLRLFCQVSLIFWTLSIAEIQCLLSNLLHCRALLNLFSFWSS